MCRIIRRSLEIACLFVCGLTANLWPVEARADPATEILRIPASRIRNPELKSQVMDFRSGIGPDEAATIALYSNPALRAIRDRRGLAAVQLIRAGTLPNPVVSYARDYVTSVNTTGTTTRYNFSAR